MDCLLPPLTTIPDGFWHPTLPRAYDTSAYPTPFSVDPDSD